MQQIIKVTAAMAMAVAPTHAAAETPAIWTQVRTTQGCLVYWLRNPTMSEAEYRRSTQISFEGSGCQPGRVLNGEGTLVVTGNPTSHFRGRVANGVLEGPVEVIHHGRLGALRDDQLSSNFVGGCAPFWQQYGTCTPFSGASAQASAEPGPLGLRNMPGASGSRPGTRSSAAATSPAAAASNDVFDQCVALRNMGRSGIQVMWELRNNCPRRISLSYCLRANFEAAGDYNLCSRREYKTHSVAAGGSVQFAFNLMPDGTAMSDGRVVSDNSELRVFGHACANDNSPAVTFENGQFRFVSC